MKLWAHRGTHGSGLPLENTLAAFERAVADRADGIELDVHLSADGVPVVFHDETLSRLVAGRDDRRIDELTWQQLSEIRLIGGHSIPSLVEVMEVVANRLPINVEIKDAAAVDAVAQLLSKVKPEHYLISSFSESAVHHASRVLPGLERAWISGEARTDPTVDARLKRPHETLRACAAHRWHTDALSVTPENLSWCHAAGISVHVWTINEPAEAKRLKALGVDGIFADRAGDMRQALT